MDPVVWEKFHPNNLGSESDEFSDNLEIQLFMEDSSSEEDTHCHERYRSRLTKIDAEFFLISFFVTITGIPVHSITGIPVHSIIKMTLKLGFAYQLDSLMKSLGS